MKLNHVAMVVPNIDRFLEVNQLLYGGFTRGPVYVNETQHVREQFITDGSIVLELLEPLSEASPISAFLKRNRGGGLVHLAFDVERLEPALQRVEEAGGKVVVDPVADIAFDQRRIAFVMLNGMLTEFIESSHEARDATSA